MGTLMATLMATKWEPLMGTKNCGSIPVSYTHLRTINGPIQRPPVSWRKMAGCSLEIHMQRMRKDDSAGLSLMPMELWSLAGSRARMESGIIPMPYQTEILVFFIRAGTMSQWMESGITWMKRPELCLMAGFPCRCV